jgi:hypothetical protein
LHIHSATTRKIEYRGSQLEALEIQPPPLILLPTVIAAFSNRRRLQAITNMQSAAIMGVSVAVLFSFSLILCHELVHHHRITSSPRQPLFSIKNGKNQASGTSLLCLFEPLFPISGDET